MESAAGVVMLLATAAALLLANSPLSDGYHALVALEIPLPFLGAHSLSHMVQDGLMVLFFFVVGLELKQEMTHGFLRERGQIFLPLAAAVGGMAVPAVIYTALNYTTPETLSGWAVPSATDIAFALCVLNLAGARVPPSVKIFLLAIAIFDDLGAILIIAFFYSPGLVYVPFMMAGALSAALFFLGRARHSCIATYLLLGAALAVCLAQAGIHTTIAGVITGLCIPSGQAKNAENSVLKRAMHAFHPWVSYGVLPLFAFVSAGVGLVNFTPQVVMDSVPLGIALGLFLGKQIGIFLVTFLCVTCRFTALPDGARWGDVYAVSVIAGVGFTMSLFIGFLAFPDPALQEEMKFGVLAGSVLSSLWGAAVLRFTRRAPRAGID